VHGFCVATPPPGRSNRKSARRDYQRQRPGI